MKDQKYDLIVIGSGPAGEKGAAQAAYFGKKVAIVERNASVGGAIMNTGVPGKGLRETSLYLNGFKQRDLHGIDLMYNQNLKVKDILHRAYSVRQSMVQWVGENIERHGIDLIHGEASFVDKNSIRVTKNDGSSNIFQSDIILICCGSRPARPSIFPFEAGNIYDSDTVLNIDDIPASIIIVGAGTIGCEYACIFNHLNAQVSVVDSSESFFGFADQEIIQLLKEDMSKNGIDFHLGESVQKMESDGGQVKVFLKSGKILRSESALVAVGRRSNTESLNLKNVGLKTTTRGLIKVNHQFQTEVDNIYAAGDVIGFPALSSTSMEQARMAMVNAFDLKYKAAVAKILPYGIWTIPEVAMIGDSEENLKSKNIPYVVGRSNYMDNPRGATIGEEHGLLKLIFSVPDTRLVGVHIIGEQACELISVGMMAIRSGANFTTFIDACFNFPSLSDMYKYATYDAMNELKLRSEP